MHVMSVQRGCVETSKRARSFILVTFNLIASSGSDYKTESNVDSYVNTRKGGRGDSSKDTFVLRREIPKVLAINDPHSSCFAEIPEITEIDRATTLICFPGSEGGRERAGEQVSRTQANLNGLRRLYVC